MLGVKGKDIAKNWWLVLVAAVMVIVLAYFGIQKLSLVSFTIPVQVLWSGNVTVSGLPTPVTNYSNGFVARIYCQSFIVDSAANYNFRGTPQEVTSGNSFTDTVSFTPTAAGQYAYGAVCVRTNSTYNYTSLAWYCPANCDPNNPKYTDPNRDMVGNDKGTITVTGPGAPPNPNINLLSLSGVISFIKNFLCSTFGWFC